MNIEIEKKNCFLCEKEIVYTIYKDIYSGYIHDGVCLRCRRARQNAQAKMLISILETALHNASVENS